MPGREKVVILAGSAQEKDNLMIELTNQLVSNGFKVTITLENIPQFHGAAFYDKIPYEVRCIEWGAEDSENSGTNVMFRNISREDLVIKAIKGAVAVINLLSLNSKLPTYPRESDLLKEGQRHNIISKRLYNLLSKVNQKPKMFINCSNIGFYGFPLEVSDEEITEMASPGNDFYGQLYSNLEKEYSKLEQMGISVVELRVPNEILFLSSEDAKQKVQLMQRMSLSSVTFRGGNHWNSWIHIRDFIEIIIFIIRNSLRGCFNICLSAKEKDMLAVFREVLLIKEQFHNLPAWIIILILGGEGSKLHYTGRKVISKRVQDAGYEFHFPTLRAALEDCLHDEIMNLLGRNSEGRKIQNNSCCWII